jgi:hypothetical protein
MMLRILSPALVLTLVVAVVTMQVRAEDCPAPATWFPKTPRPTYAKPDPDSDCEFYRWAWQTFLYVTQSEGNDQKAIRLLSYQTPQDLFEPLSATPRFAKNAAPPDKPRLRLSPRLAKHPEAVSLQEFLQADSKGVLVDRNGRVVYYAQHVNDVFVKFVDDNKFRNPDNIFKAPADLEFPRGCLELKSSWKVLGPGDNPDNFFWTEASVAKLALENGTIVIKPNLLITEKVGLVGLHVVGVVDGHPEFVWATFEHNDNAPNLNPGDPAGGTQVLNAIRDFSFYAKGTQAKDCNKKQTLTFKDENAQTFAPTTPIMLHFPFGGEPQVDDAIDSLNKSVYASIDKLAPDLKVWKNYRLSGAVWMNNTAYFREGFDFAKDDAMHPEKRILGGEKKLSNSTMETFTQAAKVNCFTCHKTTGETMGMTQMFPPKRIGVSHILTNAYINSKQAK